MSRTVEWMKFVVKYIGKTKGFERNMRNVSFIYYSVNDYV